MLRSRHFFIFFAIFALGLFAEGLKSFRDMKLNETSNTEARLSLRDIDTRPYHLSQSHLQRESSMQGKSRGGVFRLAGQPEPAQKITSEYDFSEGHKVASDAKAKQEADAKAKTDPDKKKKKAKKKKKSKADDANKNKQDEVAQDDDQDKEAQENDEDGDTSAVNQFVAQNDGTQKNSDIPVSFEDWAKLVLGRPQPENVKKLIEYYQNNLVGADVYFALLEAMMNESNPKQHELALYAAGSVHTPQSFNFLIEVIKGESQGTELVAKAKQYLNNYRSLQYVGALKSVLMMNMSDAGVVHEAVIILDKSTEAYLEDRKPSAEAGNTSADGLTDTQKKQAEAARMKQAARRAYAGFEPVLERVISVYAGQSEITTPAQSALRRIKSFNETADSTADQSGVKVADTDTTDSTLTPQ